MASFVENGRLTFSACKKASARGGDLFASAHLLLN
jgi:hypothetical protein